MPGEKEAALTDTKQILARLCEHFDHLEKWLELLLKVSLVRVRKTLMHKHQRMEPAVGFEPTTDGLQNRCSTTELSWPGRVAKITANPNFGASPSARPEAFEK